MLDTSLEAAFGAGRLAGVSKAEVERRMHADRLRRLEDSVSLLVLDIYLSREFPENFPALLQCVAGALRAPAQLREAHAELGGLPPMCASLVRRLGASFGGLPRPSDTAALLLAGVHEVFSSHLRERGPDAALAAAFLGGMAEALAGAAAAATDEEAQAEVSDLLRDALDIVLVNFTAVPTSLTAALMAAAVCAADGVDRLTSPLVSFHVGLDPALRRSVLLRLPPLTRTAFSLKLDGAAARRAGEPAEGKGRAAKRRRKG